MPPTVRLRCCVGFLRLRSSTSGSAGACTAAAAQIRAQVRCRARGPRRARRLPRRLQPRPVVGSDSSLRRRRQPRLLRGCWLGGLVGLGRPGCLIGRRLLGLFDRGNHGRPAVAGSGASSAGANQDCPAGAGSDLGSDSSASGACSADQDCSAGAASSAGSSSETVWAGSDWANTWQRAARGGRPNARSPRAS